MKRANKHIVAWSIVAVVVVTLGCWVGNRWNVWFYNVPERPYTPSSQPSRILLTFGNEGELSRNVSWQYATIVPSHLQLINHSTNDTSIIVATSETFTSRGGTSCYYVARLLQLSPATTYSYRVVNDTMASPYYTFTTQTTTSATDFIYIGDLQDTLGQVKNQSFKQMLRHHPTTEFLLFGGDWAERPCDNYWQQAFNSIDSIGQTLPILCITGNHEYIKHIPLYVERRFALTFSYFLDAMDGDNHVYTLRKGDTQFYFLDSNREFPHLLQQRRWLKKQMANSTAKWNILVLHHPIHSIRGPLTNLFVRLSFGSLANQCDLVLQGHEHNYARMTTKDRDNTPTTPISIVSHWSPKNYRLYHNSHYNVFGENLPTYQAIHINGDTLQITTYNANNFTPYDEVKVVKKDTKKEVIATNDLPQ